MSYKSRMVCDVFECKLELDQLNKLAAEYFSGAKSFEYQFQFDFEIGGRKYYYPINARESWANNYDTDQLAVFLADVTETQASVYFTGEDGSWWGYMIYPGRAMALQMLEGPILYENKERVKGGENGSTQ